MTIYACNADEERRSACEVRFRDGETVDCESCKFAAITPEPKGKPEDGVEDARLIYLLGQIKGVAACISEHRIRTTLTMAADGILEILLPTDITRREDMDK